MNRLKVYKPTKWQDNLVQFAGRFKVEDLGDGLVTVDKSPGEVFQEGTPVEEETMNNIEAGIKENNRFIISNINNIKSMQLQISILQATVTGDVSGDVYVDDLSNLDSLELSRGIFDEADGSIYCVDSGGERVTLTGYAIAIG